MKGALVAAEAMEGAARTPRATAALLRAVRAGAFAAGAAAAVGAASRGSTAGSDAAGAGSSSTTEPQTAAGRTGARPKCRSGAARAHADPGIGVDTQGARRRDAPPQHRYQKGSLNKARRALRSGKRKAQAMEQFMADRFAPSTRRTRASRTQTLERLIVDAGLPRLPITAEGLYSVAAALKAGGYRTGRSYLGLWETLHREGGYVWTDELSQAKAWSRRSIERGMGPARSAAAIDFAQWAATAEACDDADMVIVGALWMLRGAEIAGLLVEQARTGPGALVASLDLMAHKTNIEGAACSRTLRCTCPAPCEAGGGGTDLDLRKAICPTHALARVLARRVTAAQGAVDAGKHALFPGRSGRACTAAEARRRIKGTLRSDAATEHSLRRMGAQFYAKRGIALPVIQHLGRWGSQAVERYVGEALAGRSAWAPLAAAGECDADRMLGARDPQGRAPGLNAIAGFLRNLVQQQVGQSSAAASTTSCTPVDRTPAYVVAGRSGVGHVVMVGGPGIPREAWETACHWRFGLRPHTASEDVSVLSCARCVGALAGRNAQEGSPGPDRSLDPSAGA